MDNISASNFENEENDDLLPEYNFDYTKARPNRFVNRVQKSDVTVILDADIAEVFKTSEAVNHALRALLSAMPKVER